MFKERRYEVEEGFVFQPKIDKYGDVYLSVTSGEGKIFEPEGLVQVKEVRYNLVNDSYVYRCVECQDRNGNNYAYRKALNPQSPRNIDEIECLISKDIQTLFDGAYRVHVREKIYNFGTVTRYFLLKN